MVDALFSKAIHIVLFSCVAEVIMDDDDICTGTYIVQEGFFSFSFFFFLCDTNLAGSFYKVDIVII